MEEKLKFIIVWGCFTTTFAISCDSCGGECAAACGTRNFRTCCFNYLKKRNVEPPSGPQMRFELLMVLPELMQHYRPALKHILPTLDSNDDVKGPPFPESHQIQLLYKNTQPSSSNPTKMDGTF